MFNTTKASTSQALVVNSERNEFVWGTGRKFHSGDSINASLEMDEI